MSATRPAGLITPEDRATWEKWASEQAQTAFRKGEACLSSGDASGALMWLERAHRMAADSPNVALLLALARQACGYRAEAIAVLAPLATKYDSGQIWLLLARARLAAGEGRVAAYDLRRALSATVCTKEAVRLADQITKTLNLAGWCALDGSGAIRLGGAVRNMMSEKTSGRCKSGWQERLCVTVNGAEKAFTWDGDCLRFTQGESFWSLDRVEVSLDGEPLVGSPLHPATARRVQGAVTAEKDGLGGWAWFPANPDEAPVLRILDANGRCHLTFTAEQASPEPSAHVPLARYRAISVPFDALPEGLVHVVEHTGRDLTGSPIDPGLERRAGRWALEQARYASLGTIPPASVAPPFLPVDVRSPSAMEAQISERSDAPILIVIPVYRDVPRTRDCLRSVLASLPEASRNSPRVLVINDASPDPDMESLLHTVTKDTRVTVLTNETNRGFVVSANLGLQAALSAKSRPRDVVLLNSDTLVAGEWLDELRTVAYSAPDIGTVTPLSNDATIFSYPSLTANPVPSVALTSKLMTLVRAANGGVAVDVPTGHGFCLYLRHDCLSQTGLLRADLFAQGYGEENDFCLRARQAGWRNVAAPGAYVAHVGSVSFGATKDALLRRNAGVINRLHPGYDALIAEYVGSDPLFEPRRRIDLLRWRQEARRHARSGKGQVVLLVTHDYGGGVERVVKRRVVELTEAGMRPIMIRPVRGGCRIESWRGEEDDTAPLFSNLRFSLPDEWSRLLRLLTADPVDHIEWHHASGHHMAMRELANVLDVPYDVYVHDYIWFCPRITLIGVSGRYCGEPEINACERCVSVLGRKVEDETPLAAYVARSTEELAAARKVIVPSDDVAKRMRRHFPGLAPHVAPLEDDRPSLSLERFSASFRVEKSYPVTGIPRVAGRCRICVVGAIGQEKGYDVLLAAAEDAALHDRPIEYVIVGHTPDDDALMATGHVHVTGAYREEGEAVALIRAMQPDYGFVPSVCPETWCFTLGVAWHAGMRVAAFDLGAVADRIRTTGRGFIMPVGVSAEQLNVILISACQQHQGRLS